MKNKRLIYILLPVFIGVGVILLFILQKEMHQKQQTLAEKRAEQIILSYINAKGLNIQPGTDDYTRLMKGILLGEYPDLTGENSVFIGNDVEREYIIDYAASHMNAESERKYREPDVEEVQPTSYGPSK